MKGESESNETEKKRENEKCVPLKSYWIHEGFWSESTKIIDSS